MLRWFLFLISIALGIAAALYVGWVVLPAQTIEASPSTLRQDYKTDYVLMVSEVYRSERDLKLAVERLGFLSSRPPAALVSEAVLYASKNNWPEADLAEMQALGTDLAAMSAGTEVPSP
jgi:hypothetical protein